MITEDYATALKNLIALTQTKNLVLANITGYDISYISKWCNGIKLPATKHIEQINEKMAHYFADTLIKDHKQKAASAILSISSDATDFSFEINQYLCSAYRFSLKKNSGKSKEYASPIQVITGYHDITKFMTELFQNKIPEIETEGNLLIFGEFCALSDIGFWNYFESCQLNASRLTIRVGLNLNKLASDLKYMRRLYHMLNDLLDYDFMFYDSTTVECANLIILENSFVIQYSLHTTGLIDMCTYIPDKVLVQDIYDRFFLCFTHKNPLMASAKVLGIDEMGFRTAFYSAKHFFFFLTNGFDFLLPSDTIDNILKTCCAPENVVHQIRHLRIMWEEFMSTVDVEFMLPTTSIIRYIETGYMFFTDLEYRTSPQERKAHLQNIISMMKKNPRIIMGILQASIDTIDYHESNLSFYSNLSSAFFKKNRQYITNEASPFYIVADQQLVTIFQSFFQRLKQFPVYHQYTYDEIKTNYELYKNFVERTLGLLEE
ncbi:hypothetical protein [Megasphaera sueciensis]|uniref:hypothetical protein n=1 Tax=Megasphaera sueciensis TaxID=349094 RepID=UPI003D004556